MSLPANNSANASVNSNSMSGVPGTPQTPAPAGANQPKINEMIIPFLEPSAYQRLTRILMVRPERVRQVEQYIVMLAQQGQLNQHKISDVELKNILDGISRNESATSNKEPEKSTSGSSTRNNGKFTQGIVINRRGGFMDDSDDDLDFGMPTTSNYKSNNSNSNANNNNNNNNNAAEDSDDDFFD